MSALGGAWTPGIERTVEMGAQGGFFQRVWDAVYIFYGPEGEMHAVAAKPFFQRRPAAAFALLAFECLSLLRQMFFGGRRARRLLRPLDEMARATRALLERQQTFEHAPLDDERLHDLEDRIKSMRPEETLRTGDRDLRGLEEAVNSLLARLHESYQRQGQFVSDASHELRTPIAVIQGYAAMLDRWGKSDEKILDEGIAAIKSESEYMKKLVDQLLFLARGDMGRSRLDMQLLNVSELVKEVYEDSQLIDRNHDWRIETEEGVTALADATCSSSAAAYCATTPPSTRPQAASSACAHGARGTAGRPSKCRIPASASAARTFPACSTASTAPTRRADATAAARGWVCPSPAGSSKATAGTLRCSPARASARDSP